MELLACSKFLTRKGQHLNITLRMVYAWKTFKSTIFGGIVWIAWFLGVLFSWKFQSNGCFPRWFLLVISSSCKGMDFYCTSVVFDHLSEAYTFSDMFTPSFSGVIYFKNPCTLGGKKETHIFQSQKPKLHPTFIRIGCRRARLESKPTEKKTPPPLDSL